MERMSEADVEEMLRGATHVQNNADGSVVYKNGAGILIIVRATQDGDYVVRTMRAGCRSCSKKR